MEQPAPIAPPPGYGNTAAPAISGQATPLSAAIGEVLMAVDDLNDAIAGAQDAARHDGVNIDVRLKSGLGQVIFVSGVAEKIGATVAVIHGGR